MAYTELCGSKLRAKLGAVLNEGAVSHSPATLPASQSFAKRQMEKMGWSEGTGLGKNRDGRTDHVRVKQREQDMGLGLEKKKVTDMAVEENWWRDSAGGTLAKLQAMKKRNEELKKSKKKDKKSKKSDKKSKKKRKTSDDDEQPLKIKTFTDQELFEATGGARFGMRAQRRAENKWKRTESDMGTGMADLEEKAKKDMEWNGRGSAKVVVSEKPKKRKRSSDDEEGEAVHRVSPIASEDEIKKDDDGDNVDKEERRRKKKEEKKEKKREKKRLKDTKVVSPPASEEEVTQPPTSGEDEKKKKKKRKKGE